MNMKDYAPAVNQQEYRAWRLNGIAFETRLAQGSIPNRTLASDVPGKTRKGRDSVMVRGFWGDIINSPYFAFGQEVWKEPERTRFFKKCNYQSVYSNADISEYNVQGYIQKLEDLNEYEFPFERLRHILGDRYDSPRTREKKAKEAAEKKKAKKKKEEEQKAQEEPMIQEITEEEAQQMEE